MGKGEDIPVIIGTRGSELALWQARFTQSELQKHGIKSELKIIKTKGDATQEWNLSFDKIEGKGFFTKELEDALLANEIDLAVHSCKDLPTEYPEGLAIAAYSKRANPFDLLLIKKDKADAAQFLQLPWHAKVGTSSARRKAQLLAFRPDVQVEDLRGNVPTRVQKLRDGKYDAILLAKAGLDRLQLDLSEFETLELKAPMFIPAPAQGVLAFEIRNNDEQMKNICSLLNDENAAAITKIERDLLRDFEGGCQVPLGVFSERINDVTHVWISQAAAWNSFPRRMHVSMNDTALKDFDSRKTVESFRNFQPVSVFISSELQEDDILLRSLRAHHCEINYRSLLKFSPVDFEFNGEADWLFFSSKNAIDFFLSRVKQENIQHIKIAAVGESTAQYLRSLGLQVNFTGNGVGAVSAKLFEDVAEGRVVFPMAAQSLREVQKNITGSQVHCTDLVVYQNTPQNDISRRDEQILVFTSPMNAAAYFTINCLQEGQRVIANGPSTSKKLTELHVAHTVSFSPYLWSLLDSIFSC